MFLFCGQRFSEVSKVTLKIITHIKTINCKRTDSVADDKGDKKTKQKISKPSFIAEKSLWRSRLRRRFPELFWPHVTLTYPPCCLDI